MKATLFIKVKVTPGSNRTEFCSVMEDGCCKIRLKASPVDGKANAELILWISKQFGVQRDSVFIKSGNASRRKTVKIISPSRTPLWYHE
ncbi:MAG: YggU family protein [Candidatus Sabulitectum sp.]|nr:YggU family protein [Candidatus Sabulitectum sp.]